MDMDMKRREQAQPKKGGMREMMIIAIPMIISQACYTLMTFTDRMFLSRLGPEYMNAAMGGGLTVFMMMTFFWGLTGYATVLVAQYLGSGNKKHCAIAITQSVIIVFLAYPIILACRPLAHSLFAFMGITPNQLAPQKLYFDILLYAVILSLLRNSFSSFFSGIGKTKIIMIASFTAMSVNVCVNYLLIFGKFGFPALGIRGAAYGTIIGAGCGLSVLLASYFSKANRKEYGVLRSFRFDKKVTGILLHFGYPAGLEMFLNLLAFDIIIMIFHSMGPVVATASTIVFNWDMVSFVPLLGMEIGVISLVGRYMGAGDPATAHKSTMSGLKLGLIYSAFVLFFFIIFPSNLVEVFRPTSMGVIFIQAKPIAVFMIRMAALYVLVEAMLITFIGALRGAGDTFWAMLISVALHWIIVPILFIMLKVMGMPLQICWSVMVAIFFLFSFVLYLRYRSGHWKKIKVIRPISQAEPAVVQSDFHEPSDL